jgi:hypothetical protein
MTNRTLRRRLAAIETKLDAIERKHTLPQKRSVSAQQAERTHRMLMGPHPRPENSGKLSPEEAVAEYQRLVQGPAPPLEKKRR